MLGGDLKASIDSLADFIDAEDLGAVRIVRFCHNKAVDLYVLGMYALGGIAERQLIGAVSFFLDLGLEAIGERSQTEVGRDCALCDCVV